MTDETQRIFNLMQTSIQAISDSDVWRYFLKTAAWHFKYSFNDQVLIFAQKSEATACAGMDDWVNKTQRWVKKDASPIALVRENGNQYCLDYVFDISDTQSYGKREINLWQYDKRYEEAVIQTLEWSFGKLKVKTSDIDAIICVGSVLNYCDAVQSIRELARVLKPGGYMVLEFERSNTGELWGSKEYGKGGTFQKYEYMGHVHTLCLYSERLIVKLLQRYGLQIIKYQRFHCLSALINRLTKQEEASGRFGRLDTILTPVSYLMAHNTIMLCKKGL